MKKLNFIMVTLGLLISTSVLAGKAVVVQTAAISVSGVNNTAVVNSVKQPSMDVSISTTQTEGSKAKTQKLDQDDE